MKTRYRSLAGVMIAAASLAPQGGSAQVQTLVIGEGGVDWIDSIEETIGVDTTAVAAGTIQPFELDPAVNIASGPVTKNGNLTNTFGEIWGFRRASAGLTGTAPAEVTTDGSPFIYGSRGAGQIVDGDTLLASDPDPIAHYTIDLGFPLPISRVSWFSPPSGRTTTREFSGQLIKDLFPRQYVLSASLNAAEFLSTPTSTNFVDVIENNPNQVDRVADVRFEAQFMRYVRVRFPTRGFIAEMEFYGEGFVPGIGYVSRLFDMGEPVNFGRLHYEFERVETTGFGTEHVLTPDADVSLAVRTRSGRDDTPLIHHVVTELGTEWIVDVTEFNRAPAPAGGSTNAPGQQGSVQDDLANWSFWSASQLESGEAIGAPDGRQFFQVRAFMTSEEMFSYGRLRSITVEFSPLLANPVVAEVALLDEPSPQDGVVEVPLGEPVTLTYDVRAEFSSASQVGFNGLRLSTPEPAEFQRFEMGDPLVEVPLDSMFVRDESLEIYFPSNPVQQGANVPLRLTFVTRVFNFSTIFEGEVFQIGGENLPQSIDGGNASDAVSTNDLIVIAPLNRLEVLSELAMASSVLTPNGDGFNDGLRLSYSLHGVQSANVEVAIHDLSCRVVHRLAYDVLGAGRYTDTWDGTVDGTTVPPGTYLVRVAVDTDLGTFEQTRVLAIAY
ncbi:MAG TPA: hypothetical protein EYQ31_00515 [Candidatus Handelsmanbacteria bacterium]|nr:hypothetical protein [Candidatus Handelsmanbacteria bacterium]